MYKNRTVSVVMPAYNEGGFIFNAVTNYRGIPEVDEVIVVDNNSQDNTAELARMAGAIVLTETAQGYGHASRKALLSASSDNIIIVESDGTFCPHDLEKLLAYSDEFDVIFGTRTSKACIWRGANMGHFLRYGNAFVAKLLEYVHDGPCLTDVGCTAKLIRREALWSIKDHLTVGGSHFSPALMIVAIRSGLRCVEIPVNYKARIGESKITGSMWRAFKLGMRMIFMILSCRFVKYQPVASSISASKLTEIGGWDALSEEREISA
jgi:glycosyltransferase involved in cell wall biosynthesis